MMAYIYIAINFFTSSILPLSHSSIFVQPKYAHLLQGFVGNKVLGIPDDLPENKGTARTIDNRR